MSKKRNKNIMANEEYEKKHKEIRDFNTECDGWARASAGWFGRGWKGKTQMEFETSCIWHFMKILLIPILLIIFVAILKGCSSN